MTDLWTKAEEFLTQKTTILGLATLGATLAAVIAHQIGWATAAAPLVFAALSIALPERSDIDQAGSTVASDAVAVVQARGLGTSTLKLGADLVTLAGLVHPDTPVVPVTTAPAVPAPVVVTAAAPTLPAAEAAPAQPDPPAAS